MVYIPQGWTADKTIDKVELRIWNQYGDEIPKDDIVSGDWISEYDFSYVSHPVDEFDFSLSNINGDWDRDNPNSKIGMLELNTGIIPKFYIESEGQTYIFPLGKFVVNSLSYSEDEVSVTCYSPTISLQTSVKDLTPDAPEEDRITKKEFFEQVCEKAAQLGVEMQYIDRNDVVDPTIEEKVIQTVVISRGVSINSTNLFGGLVYRYVLDGGNAVTVNGVTVRRAQPQGVVSQFNYSGTPTQAGTFYVPFYRFGTTLTDIQDLVGYVKFVSVPNADDQFLIRYLDDSLTFRESLDLAFATVLDGYNMKNDREEGLVLTNVSDSPVTEFIYKKDEVLVFPQIKAIDENVTDVLVHYTDEFGNEQSLDYQFPQYDKVRITDEVDCRIEANDSNFPIPISQTNMSWASYYALRYAVDKMTSQTNGVYSVQLLDSPEVDAGDTVIVEGRWGKYPLYISRVDLHYDGGLTTDIEGRRMPMRTWDEVKNKSEQTEYTWRYWSGTYWAKILMGGSGGLIQ